MTQRSQCEIIKRSIFLEKQFRILQTIFPEFIDLQLSRGLIGNIGISYFDDINRMKKFHDKMKLANKYKIAAYTAKWIIFLRPIQFPQEDIPKKNKERYLANEYFALHCISAILEKNFLELDKMMLLNLLYTLRYRYFTGRLLSTLLYSIDLNCPKKSCL